MYAIIISKAWNVKVTSFQTFGDRHFLLKHNGTYPVYLIQKKSNPKMHSIDLISLSLVDN